jgi:hypothetical protein
MVHFVRRIESRMEASVTDFEGRLNRVGVELTEVRLKDIRVLKEDGSPRRD